MPDIIPLQQYKSVKNIIFFVIAIEMLYYSFKRVYKEYNKKKISYNCKIEKTKETKLFKKTNETKLLQKTKETKLFKKTNETKLLIQNCKNLYKIYHNNDKLEFEIIRTVIIFIGLCIVYGFYINKCLWVWIL